MGVRLSVELAFGIDYGLAKGDGAAEVLIFFNEAWERSSRNGPQQGECTLVMPNGGGDGFDAERLVATVGESIPLWCDWDTENSASAVPAEAIIAQNREREGAMAAVLRAYCDANGLPWRAPQWLVLVDCT